MPRTSISIDSRLNAICAMCGKSDTLADIGTDHGRLGAYMLQTNMCSRAIFTDISENSLNKARRLIALLGLSNRAAFFCGDGAMPLLETPDVAVIAGMGGETIADIVENGMNVLRGSRIVMQPNVRAPELRQRLMEHGFAIVDEDIVRDGRRLYALIAAQAGTVEYSDFEICVGPVLMKKRTQELFDFAAFKIRVINKALLGAENAELKRELDMWLEVASWRKE